MLTTNTDFQPTAYFTSDGRTPWIDVDHPDFYYDPSFKQFCHDRLAELLLLKPNWDRDGAPAINQTILAAVHQFVDALPDYVAVRPMVVPLTSGNVQLEWHHGRRALELEFELPNAIHYLKWDPANGIEDEAVISTQDLDQAIELIRWFMKGFFNG